LEEQILFQTPGPQAAQKLAAVKQQHALLRKEVRWIAKLDV
jgi:hypothetical protein